MVKIALQISCILENIDYLKAGDGFSYFLKLRCMNCGETDDVWHPVCEDDRVQESSRNAKGSNFLIKCKLCSRENSLDVCEGSKGERVINSKLNNKTIRIFSNLHGRRFWQI